MPVSPLDGSKRAGDVVTTYTYSASSGNALTKVLSTVRASDPTYTIKYTYAPALGTCTVAEECGGYLATKSFMSGATAPFKSIDRDRDANTGLIMATRDTAGVQTSYAYDAIGRITSITPAGEDATVVNYPSLQETTVTRGTPGPSDLDPSSNFEFTRYLYDGLGRLVVTQKRPPNADPGGIRHSYRIPWRRLLPVSSIHDYSMREVREQRPRSTGTPRSILRPRRRW